MKEGHKGRIYSAVFSPDGQRILTASQDSTARIWNLAGQQLAILNGHENQVVNAVFAPQDGNLILTGSIDKTARLWNADGELLATLKGHSADVGHLTFSPDGQLLLTAVDGGGTPEGVVRLWNRSGQLLATLEGHDNNEWISQIAFSPDGQRILTRSQDKTIRIWSLTGETLAVLQGQFCIFLSATFSPTGRSILTASQDTVARLWEPTKSVLPLIEDQQGAILSAVYHTYGTRILTSSSDGKTRLWDTAGHLRAVYNGSAKLLTDDVLSPDGRHLLTIEQRSFQVPQSSSEGIQKLRRPEWDITVKDIITAWDIPVTSQVLQSSSDDELPVISPVEHTSSDGGLPVISPVEHYIIQVHLWQLPLNDMRDFENENQDAVDRVTQQGVHTDDGRGALDTPVVTITISEDAPQRDPWNMKAVFSPDGKGILTLADNHSKLWDCQGNLVSMLSETLSLHVAMFSPDSQRVLGSSMDGNIWVWTKDGQLITSFRTHEKSTDYDQLFSITFSPDGQRLLTTIRHAADLWDINGRHLATLPSQTNKVERGLFSPNGDRILTVGEAAIPDVRLWDGDGNLISRLDAIGGEITPIKFDPQGKMLCIVDRNIAKLWDQDGSLITTLVNDRETWINNITFSSDGKYLLLATSDGITQLWAISDRGTLQSTFKGNISGVKSVVFSPDRKRVLTVSSDGTARQFLIPIDELLYAAARRVGRALDTEEVTLFNIQTPLRFDPKAFWCKSQFLIA